MLIGITGQIGAGKTTAANVLKQMGAIVIDADRIGRAVLKSNPVLLGQLTKTFGNQILTASGNLRRKALAEVAFASTKNRKLLNKIVHPYLLKELRQKLKQALRKNSVVVVDAALLFDWNLDKLMNQMLVIGCGKDKRIGRLVKRGIAKSDALARMKNQLPFRTYQRCSDRVILNNSTKLEFEKKIRQWGSKFL